METTTAILMATYNGAAHLREQLDSILAQTDTDWTLYVHDDGSADETTAIIDEYARRHLQVRVLDYPPAGGACANFLSMVQRVEARYYLFADQDDVWMPHKVERSRLEMLSLERQYPGAPVVVHSDLSVVDGQLRPLSPSFMTLTNTRPELITTFDECVLPFVTGCTMMFNAEARQAIVFPAREATMHDAWVALCCMSRGGVVSAIMEPLVRYRQHGTNAVGARDISTVTPAYRLRHLLQIARNNLAHYRMLRRLGYGSPLKYICHKRRYRQRARGKQ